MRQKESKNRSSPEKKQKKISCISSPNRAFHQPVRRGWPPVGIQAPELKVGEDDVGVAHADGTEEGEVVEALDALQSVLHCQPVLEGFHVNLGRFDGFDLSNFHAKAMESYLERKMFPEMRLLEFIRKVPDRFMELFVARPVAP